MAVMMTGPEIGEWRQIARQWDGWAAEQWALVIAGELHMCIDRDEAMTGNGREQSL